MLRTSWINVATTISIKESDIEDTIITAIESGISYWAAKVRPVEPGADQEPDGSYRVGYYGPAAMAGGVIITDNEGEAHQLDRAAIQRGLELAGEQYSEQLATMHDDPWDAWMSDVFVQLCIFGEVIYG